MVDVSAIPTLTASPTASITASTLQSGWNLVARQVTPAVPVTASALCDTLSTTVTGSAYEIDRWENSGWEGHRCGLAANNFTLEAGRGYFVRVTKPVTWLVAGTRIITPPSLALATGWNLVGVGAVTAGTVTAPSGCTAMDGMDGTGTVVELDRWEAGAWEGHRFGLPVNAFPLQAGRGYFIRPTRPATWALAGGAPLSLNRPQGDGRPCRRSGRRPGQSGLLRVRQATPPSWQASSRSAWSQGHSQGTRADRHRRTPAK